MNEPFCFQKNFTLRLFPFSFSSEETSPIVFDSLFILIQFPAMIFDTNLTITLRARRLFQEHLAYFRSQSEMGYRGCPK